MLVVDLTFWQDVPAEDSFKEIRKIASGISMESLKKHDPNTVVFLKDDLFCFLAIKAVGKRYYSEEDETHFWRVLLPQESTGKMFMFDMHDPDVDNETKAVAFTSMLTILNDDEAEPPIEFLQRPVTKCKNPKTLAGQLSILLTSAVLPFCIQEDDDLVEVAGFELPTEEPKVTLLNFFVKILRGEIREGNVYLCKFYHRAFLSMYKNSVEINNLFVSKTIQHNPAYTYLYDDLMKAIYKVFIILFIYKSFKSAKLCSIIQRRVYMPSPEELEDILKNLIQTSDPFGFSNFEDMPDDLEYALLMTQEEARKVFGNLQAQEEAPSEDEVSKALKFSRKSDKVS